MTLLFSLIIAAAIGVAGFVYTDRYLSKKEAALTKRKKWIYAAITAVFFAVLAVSISLLYSPDDRSIFLLLRAEALIFSTYYLSIIDYKLKVIPNQYLLAMLIFVVVMFGAQALLDFSSFKMEIILALLGSVICGLLFLVTNVLSHNGLGMGDVKLVFIAGLYIGLDELLGGLVWAMVFSLIVGVVLMICKKAKLKTKIPMAPFFFLGFLFSNIIYIVSGAIGG